MANQVAKAPKPGCCQHTLDNGNYCNELAAVKHNGGYFCNQHDPREKAPMCSQHIWHRMGNGSYFTDCRSKGVVQRPDHHGKPAWFCKQHDPEVRKAKHEKWLADFHKKMDDSTQRHEHTRAADTACEGLTTEQLEAGLIAKMVDYFEEPTEEKFSEIQKLLETN